MAWPSRARDLVPLRFALLYGAILFDKPGLVVMSTDLLGFQVARQAPSACFLFSSACDTIRRTVHVFLFGDGVVVMLKQGQPESYSFSVQDLEKMIEVGVFDGQHGHVELVEGEILRISPASERHDLLVRRLTMWSAQQQFGNSSGTTYEVAVQLGLRLDQSESMLEPDVFWVRSDHAVRPDTRVVPLVIEVALSSLHYDTHEKLRLYAMDGLQEYWVVDVDSETIQVRTDPCGEQFQNLQVFGRGSSVSPQCRPGASLEVDWLFRAGG